MMVGNERQKKTLFHYVLCIRMCRFSPACFTTQTPCLDAFPDVLRVYIKSQVQIYTDTEIVSVSFFSTANPLNQPEDADREGQTPRN